MDRVTDELGITRRELAKDIVGEIVLSSSPEKVIKKWREIFRVSQKRLAESLGITSSVISDYESGRRKSPGIVVIRKYVNTLLEIDAGRGGQVIRTFVKNSRPLASSGAIMDMREFCSGIPVSTFCRQIAAPLVTEDKDRKHLYGYTVVDSFKAITEFSHSELIQLYGTTTQRALVFTKVETGRTPLVAIKLTGLHPGLVVLHGLDTVDEVAKRIAEVEGIPLAVCRLESEDKIVERLSKLK